MPPSVTIVDTPLQDPFENTVVISGILHNLEGATVAAEGMFAAIQATVRHPLLILEMQQQEVDYFFYHKIDEQNSLLVGTQKAGDHFITTVCQKNPSPAQLSFLYKKAVRIR